LGPAFFVAVRSSFDFVSSSLGPGASEE